MKSIKLKVKKLSENAIIPKYQSEGAACFDLHACLESDYCLLSPYIFEDDSINRAAIPTGLSFQIPENYELQIRPRSGLAFKHGITVLNTPGTIDSDFTGEVKVILVNHSNDWYQIKNGDRIAQAILSPVKKVTFEEVTELKETKRGNKGFGSTGFEQLNLFEGESK